jgi:hypothetical protein
MTSRFQRGKECDKQKRELQWEYLSFGIEAAFETFLPRVSSIHMLMMVPTHTAVHYQRVFLQW